MNKIIHYCWFGGNQKSKMIKKCISSWREFFPDWEIREWNEHNFDISCNEYVSQAYKTKMWAFVSDYCRFWALEQYGGIYFDTDVEVIKSFEPLLANEAFAGFETDRYVAPGLVLYAKNPFNKIISETKIYYDTIPFLNQGGERIRVNVCSIFTEVLEKHGLVPNGHFQVCDGMTLYPQDYFCPFDDATGLLNITDNSYAIHWYDKSWMSKGKVLRNRLTRVLHRWFGKDIRRKVAKFVSR